MEILKGFDMLDSKAMKTLLVPVLLLFLGSILRISTHVLPLFSVFCTMQLPLQVSNMDKLGFMLILFIIIILWFQ